MKPAMELGILSREGMKALAEGNVGNAMFLLSQALDKAKCFKTRLNEAKIHNNLGLASLLGDNREKATFHFTQARDCVVSEIGEDNHLYRAIMANMNKVEHTGELNA